MPVRWEIDQPFIRICCVGTYAPHEMRDAWRDLVAQPEWPARPRLLVDISGSKSVGDRSIASLRETASFFSGELRYHRCRTALIASNDLAFGLMRMVSAWLDLSGVPVAAFRSEREAKAWLLADDASASQPKRKTGTQR